MKEKGPFKTALGDIGFDEKGDIKLPGYVMYEWKKGEDGKYSYFDSSKLSNLNYCRMPGALCRAFCYWTFPIFYDSISAILFALQHFVAMIADFPLLLSGVPPCLSGKSLSPTVPK